jgi:hypothetical protein
MEMVAVNLLREGVNKHKARELAEHFYSFAPAAPVQPVAYWIPKAEQFCMADPSGRPFAKAWEPLYTTPPAQPAPVQEPIGYEKYAAIREGHRNASEETYFAARPDLPLTTAMLKLFRDGFDRGYDTTPPAQPAVPEGWKLVPVEPTDEMLAAADEGDREYTLRNFGDVQTVMQGPYDHYVAMLAAAPEKGN